MDEQWKQIEDWPYEVSDQGRVRRSRAASGTQVGCVLRQHLTRDGYLRVPLRLRPGQQRKILTHQLVLRAFVGRCPKGWNANHKNGIKADNRLENLEWVSLSANQLHAIESGLYGGRGEKHGRAKLTEAQVREIRAQYTGAYGEQTRLAKEYGVSPMLISKIVRGEVWTHIDTGPVVLAARVVTQPHGSAKLTERRVRAIRARHTAGEDYHALAKRFGVGRQIIRDIVLRKTWKHVT